MSKYTISSFCVKKAEEPAQDARFLECNEESASKLLNVEAAPKTEASRAVSKGRTDNSGLHLGCC
jgi:hypothetical protein